MEREHFEVVEGYFKQMAKPNEVPPEAMEKYKRVKFMSDRVQGGAFRLQELAIILESCNGSVKKSEPVADPVAVVVAKSVKSPKNPPVEAKCVFCGESFTAKWQGNKKVYGKLCSRACIAKFSAQKRKAEKVGV